MKHYADQIMAGNVSLELSADMTGEGIVVFMAGGTKEHVGGVAMSVPRESLSGNGPSCDTWVIPVPGHKDSIVAEKASAWICRELRMPAVVTAGIHIDNATAGQIADIEAACVLLSDRLIAWAASVGK